MPVTAVVPIRSFDGLSRLGAVLDDAERFALMRRLVTRTVGAITAADCAVVVVSGDAQVRSWASANGVGSIDDPGTGLDAAAAAGTAAVGSPWLVVHADLPAITPEDVAVAVSSLDDGAVLAPSHDGGTSLIGADGASFPFAYGVGSFSRHLATVPDATVVVRPGLALDLDRAADLAAFRTLGVL